MAEAVLTPREQAQLADWNRARARREQGQRRAAWREYGPRSYRLPSMAAIGTLARPGATDDQSTDADFNQQRIAAQPPARERFSQAWQGATQGTGPQAEAVSRRSQQLAQRQAQRRQARGQTTGPAEVTALATEAIRRGYARLWDGMQQALGDLAFAWWGALSIIIFPVQCAVYFARLLSNLFGQISWRGVSVPRVPPYDWISGPFQTLQLILNGLIFLIWGLAVVVLIYLLFEFGAFVTLKT